MYAKCYDNNPLTLCFWEYYLKIPIFVFGLVVISSPTTITIYGLNLLYKYKSIN